MSLINQMLQDLDERRAAHGVGTRLPIDVRPLPKPPSSRLPVILGGVVLLVLVAGFALYQWEMKSEPAPVAVAAAVPVPVQPVPAPPVEQAASDSEKNTPAEPPAAEQKEAANPDLKSLDGSLRMADHIKPPVEKKPVARPAVPAVSEKPVPAEKKVVADRGKAEPPEKPLPASPASLPQAATKSAKTATIERNDSVGSPRERAEAEYRKAIASVNQGRIAEALDSLRNALRQDGLHSASRQLLVRLLLEAKRPDEAVLVLQDGLQIQPAQLGWAMSLARMQVDRGDLAGAWQTLNYSLPAAGNSADYQGFAAHVLQRLGRHREAVEHYQVATRLSPGEGRWWLGLGLAFEGEGRSTEAREAFLRAKSSGTLNAELSALVDQKLR